ncbi:MAG: Ribonuclease HepT-like [Candidatus Eremiobacteraeota bacterium]|nr:Ribonuclease HepT-like [Candidatus Eremiobacteraeota bacterium]
MSKHNPNQSLADALERIERAETIVTRYGFNTIRAQSVLTDALLHNLLLTAEALTRLRGEWPQRYELLEAAYPDVDWYALRKFGDVIRHGYDIIDMAIVARNMETIVASAKAAIQNELALSNIEPTS